MSFNSKHFFIIFIVTVVSSSSSSSSTSSSNFSLYGTTHMNETTISLTKSLTDCTISNSIPQLINAGRIFYKSPIPFPLHSIFNSNSTISFSTHFSFTIIPPPSNCLSGEGIAFLITSSLPHSLGSIGLPKNVAPNFVDSSFLAVEFDTNFDKDLDDINGNHVGIDLDSVSSIASVDLVTNGIDLKSGNMIHSWIEYKGLEKVIEVWVGYDEIKPDRSVLVAPIDFTRRFINGFMYVGFSAANNDKGSSVYVIHNWQFKTFGSDDCLICFPAQSKTEPATRMGLNTTHHHHNRNKRNNSSFSLALGMLLLNLILILVILGGVVLYIMCLKRSQRSGQTQPPEQTRICTFREKETSKIPKRLKLSEIRSVTKGFHRNQKIGEGQLSIVYKTDKNLAVKRFKSGSFGCQFATEFVAMVGSLHHKNLMKLQGWCCEQNELILVYDYMPNGSLEKILHHPTTNVENLSFETRLHILVGVSSALLYLHEECGRPIVHRNVKSCNIMLDFDFTPKLGDFGVAELHDHNSKSRDITVPACSMGYLAPEYVYSGVPTVKTDVYGFGVVILEVATGRPAVDENGVVVSDWVWGLWEDKRLVEAADCKLMGRFDRVEMERMLMVGLSCVHPNYEKRPTMKVVMEMLKGEVVPELPMVKPTVMVQSVTSERSPEVVVRCGGDECDGLTSWGTPKSHFSKG